MTDIGAFASEFHDNTSSLRRFNIALRFLKDSKAEEDISRTESLSIVLSMLEPISTTIAGRLSNSLRFDQGTVVQILRKRHERDWQNYSKRLVALALQLRGADPIIGPEEFELLNDVADAIDTQCAYLFRRISGRT